MRWLSEHWAAGPCFECEKEQDPSTDRPTDRGRGPVVSRKRICFISTQMEITYHRIDFAHSNLLARSLACLMNRHVFCCIVQRALWLIC